jgi:hypothetical protein
MPGINPDIAKDVTSLKKAYDLILKSQKSIVFFNEKIQRGDPFSPKSLRDSKRALDTWNSSQDKANKILEKNRLIRSKISDELKRQEKLLARQGGPQGFQQDLFTELRKADKTRAGYESLQNVIDSTNAIKGNLARAKMASRGPKVFGIPYNNNTLSGAVVGAEIGLAEQVTLGGLKNAFQSALMTRDMALMTRPGEMSRTAGQESKALLARSFAAANYNALGAAGINPGIDIMRRQAELYSTSGLAGMTGEGGFNTAANALLMEKMGMGSQNMSTLAETVGKGVTFKNTVGISLDEKARNIFADAVNLGIGGSRKGEFMATVNNLTAAAQQTAKNTDVDQFAKVMTTINAIGGNTNTAGLQGTNAGQIAMNMQNALLNPGGGIAGQIMMMRSTGFKGNITEWRKTLEKGLTDSMLDNIRKNFGGAKATDSQIWNFMKTFNQQSFTQSEALIKGDKNTKMDVNGRTVNLQDYMKSQIAQSPEAQAAATAQQILLGGQTAIANFSAAVTVFGEWVAAQTGKEVAAVLTPEAIEVKDAKIAANREAHLNNLIHHYQPYVPGRGNMPLDTRTSNSVNLGGTWVTKPDKVIPG